MDITTNIVAKLKEIEKRENVHILYAVESGSRAWGFASKDSDYDVRFVYIRCKEEYLRIDSIRDVIEEPIDEVYDINGWDLKKALWQLHKGNATLHEWCNSPVVYWQSPLWKDVAKIVPHYFSQKRALMHYYGMARHNDMKYLQDNKIYYKKYLYVLRTILACRYIEEYKTWPPVLFSELLKMELPADVRAGIDLVLEYKKSDIEQQKRPHIPALQNYIIRELAKQKELIDNVAESQDIGFAELNQLFCKTVQKFA